MSEIKTTRFESVTGNAKVYKSSRAAKQDGKSKSLASVGSYNQAKSMREKLLEKAADIAERNRREREEHPERLLLFRPRVYEFWRDDDKNDEESLELESLTKEIADKEIELLRKKNEGTFDSADEEEEDLLNQQKKVLERLKNRKAREAAYLERLDAQLEREEEERALIEAENILSELQNPSMYGWFYTNGYYDADAIMGLNEELLEKLEKQQEDWRQKWAEKYPEAESFSEKRKRHFWPPKLFCCKSMFRTRGKYLDFPEVKADRPKNTPDDVFESEDWNPVKEDENVDSSAASTARSVDRSTAASRARAAKGTDSYSTVSSVTVGIELRPSRFVTEPCTYQNVCSYANQGCSD